MLLSHSFGPGDITCVAIVPGAALVLEEIIDASYSSHFDKIPIRRLGHRLPVGWATGAGSIAGTLVCAQLTKGALFKVRSYYGAARTLGEEVLRREKPGALVTRGAADFFASAILPQQLPPIHLMWVHTSSEGQMGIARWYNVVFSDHGGVFGANQGFNEETLQYQCTFMEQIRLHRSLTVAEMQRLKGNMVSGAFTNDYYKQETLVESLHQVADDIGSDGEDLLEYLQDEAEFLAEQIRKGEPTAYSIADRGSVVFVTTDDGSVVQKDEPRPGENASDLSLEAVYEEILPARTSSGLYAAHAANARIELKEGTVLLGPDGGELTELGTGNRHVLPGARYAALIVPEAGDRLTELMPRTVTLQVDETAGGPQIVRTALMNGPVPLTKEGSFDPTGTYATTWSTYDYTDLLTIAPSGDSYELVGDIGPHTIQPTLGTFTGGRWRWEVETPAGETMEIEAVRQSDGRLRIVRSGGVLYQESGRVPLTHVTTASADTLNGSLEFDGFVASVSTNRNLEDVQLIDSASVYVEAPDGRSDIVYVEETAQAGSSYTEKTALGEVTFEIPYNASAKPSIAFELYAGAERSDAGAAGEERLVGAGERIDLALSAGRLNGHVFGISVVDAPLGTSFPLAGDLQAAITEEAAAFTLSPRTIS